MDPRLAAIEKRLAPVPRIVAVTAGKGGVGKSSVASLLALMLAERGVRVGLLDLDLTGPSDHVILGAERVFPSEERGLEPPLYAGIAFMSVSHFLKGEALPLRGPDVTNAIVEILAVTRWGDVEVLLIDMPPGLGDAALDAARWLPRAEYLVVAGSSRVIRETVRRTLALLRELSLPVAGVVENMGRAGSGDAVRALAREYGVPFLGTLLFDDGLEAALGDPVRLRETAFACALRAVRDAVFGEGGAGDRSKLSRRR